MWVNHTDIDQCHCWRNLTYQQSTLLACQILPTVDIPTEYSVSMSDFANSDTLLVCQISPTVDIPTEYSVGMLDFVNSDTGRYQYVGELEY